jgi:PAS domain S-box-containing protein
MQITDDLNKQILVVEDEGLIAADIQRRLHRLGYPVPTVASSGEEALQRVRSTPFDLILMDIRLKGSMDGITTAGLLKSEFRAPVVYMTAHSDLETVSRAKLTEPLGYLLKPITDGDLRSTVHVAIYKHEMERRVRASEAWLWTTLRSVGDAIVATDTSGEIAFMNPVAEDLTGWPNQDAHELPLLDVLSLRDESTGDPAPNPVSDLLPGETRTYNLVSRTGSQTPVEVACFENRATDELLGAILVVRDVRTRREWESRLIQSQRMEAVANLAGGLAHDFNNQLMVISGYADELCSRLSGEDREQVLEIKRVASAAAVINGQLLTLGRRDIPTLETLNVNEVIDETGPLMSQTLGAGCAIAANLGSPQGFIRGDRNQLKQVLLNLALHARDAMPSGGELRLETSTCEVNPESPDARLYRPGAYVRLRIADTGEGMDPAALSHVFEPFCNGKPGASLSLPMVHGIVTQSGGYISAQSEIGKGSSFDILLPSIGTFLELAEAPTVLLVEDEDSVRRLMHKFLERGAYQILEARNAEDAIAIADVHKTPIQVLVTDVAMSGITGTELANRLAPRHPDMKVLFVSGYRHHTLEHEGLWKDGLNLLPKPFPAVELLRRVQVLLAQ